MTNTTSIAALKEVIIDAIQDRKGDDIACLHLEELEHAPCNKFIVCTANSSTQLSSIAQSVERKTRELLQERPWHREGRNDAQWILLDYFDIVVHIFMPEARAHYQIEDLWADAKREEFSA